MNFINDLRSVLRIAHMVGNKYHFLKAFDNLIT